MDLDTANTQKNVSLPETVFKGEALSFGVSSGQAFFYKVPRIYSSKIQVLTSVEEEKKKLKDAIFKLRDNIGELLSETAIVLTEESLEIFDTYSIIVQDSFFEKELIKIIETGKTAYEASEVLSDSFRRKMRKNSIFQNRLYDMQYIIRQLRKFLIESDEEVDTMPFGKYPMILIATYISPADLLYYYRYRKIVGLVMKDRGQNSHAAIVARSLHIPTIGGIALTTKDCQNSDNILVDANSSVIYIRPSAETLVRLQRKAVAFVSRNSRDNFLKTTTKDNVNIELYLNANIYSDLDTLHSPIVKGVGLFRTEIMFMDPDITTDFDAQVSEYTKMLNKAAEKPIIFRTVDITDDKDTSIFEEEVSIQRLPEAQKAPQKEPVKFSKHLVLATPMGKVLMNKSSFLKTQVRALLRARTQSERPYDPINIMIPMVSDAFELKTYQKIIEIEAMQEARSYPAIPNQIKLGVMIEVPAIVYQVERFQPLVDFVSIGTNDLFRFFFATNRWDVRTRRAQDDLSPAFLEFLGKIVHQFLQLGIPIHVCGEMAANPMTAMALLGIGIRRLSVPPESINKIAAMVNSLSLNDLYPYVKTFRVHPYEFYATKTEKYESSVDVRHSLQTFANRHGVEI